MPARLKNSKTGARVTTDREPVFRVSYLGSEGRRLSVLESRWRRVGNTLLMVEAYSRGYFLYSYGKVDMTKEEVAEYAKEAQVMEVVEELVEDCWGPDDDACDDFSQCG